MPSRRREQSLTEVDSVSDVEPKPDFQYQLSASIPQAMESIDKWKSKRTDIRKGIDKDYTDKLTALKNKIKAHYHHETQMISDHKREQLDRLLAAVEKRIGCEDKIKNQTESLRDDCAHIAMLVDAIYSGRKEAALQLATTFKSGQSEK
ncbi:uncharacterized protein GGS22DRAFT_194635 [Annulohypoxylon maeteangense]|uniref:uncharacterized protein n=1 Tax=Annulohypoxylon maeteangense TaxID=1927788 RepID=UPI002008C2E6|nr:uncharacterized protein GGS22DRAFT_194635 [Annulohypoxylon maeteangense]KAI0890740.1 hypothetical protein GGS22DRAFT_194635 [Annulohypoxylon maeteangense]